MSLNKKKMIGEIGRRTRLKNRDVQTVIETLIEVWVEELVNGGRIEVENFCTLDIQQRQRINPRTRQLDKYSSVQVRISKKLRHQIRDRKPRRQPVF